MPSKPRQPRARKTKATTKRKTATKPDALDKRVADALDRAKPLMRKAAKVASTLRVGGPTTGVNFEAKERVIDLHGGEGEAIAMWEARIADAVAAEREANARLVLERAATYGFPVDSAECRALCDAAAAIRARSGSPASAAPTDAAGTVTVTMTLLGAQGLQRLAYRSDHATGQRANGETCLCDPCAGRRALDAALAGRTP